MTQADQIAALAARIGEEVGKKADSGIDGLPSGAVIRVIAPATTRPTARLDVTVWWIGHSTEPAGALVGDVWLEPVE